MLIVVSIAYAAKLSHRLQKHQRMVFVERKIINKKFTTAYNQIRSYTYKKLKYATEAVQWNVNKLIVIHYLTSEICHFTISINALRPDAIFV